MLGLWLMLFCLHSLQTLDVTKLTNIRLQTEIFKRINLVERYHYSDIECSQYQTVGFKLLFYQRELWRILSKINCQNHLEFRIGWHSRLGYGEEGRPGSEREEKSVNTNVSIRSMYLCWLERRALVGLDNNRKYALFPNTSHLIVIIRTVFSVDKLRCLVSLFSVPLT